MHKSKTEMHKDILKYMDMEKKKRHDELKIHERCTKMYKGAQRCTKVHKDVQRCTKDNLQRCIQYGTF